MFKLICFVAGPLLLSILEKTVQAIYSNSPIWKLQAGHELCRNSDITAGMQEAFLRFATSLSSSHRPRSGTTCLHPSAPHTVTGSRHLL